VSAASDESYQLPLNLRTKAVHTTSSGSGPSSESQGSAHCHLDRSSSKDTSSAAASLPDSEDEATGIESAVATSGGHVTDEAEDNEAATTNDDDREVAPLAMRSTSETETCRKNKQIKDELTKLIDGTTVRCRLKIDCSSNSR
jgi:hypothetical protein